jgi:hypothetical protein
VGTVERGESLSPPTKIQGGLHTMTTLNIVNNDSKKVEKVVRKTVTVRVPVDVHAKFKAIVKMASLPMQKILADFIETYVEENFNPDIHDISEDAENDAN